MEFKEFSEFPNLEEEDYDIKSSFNQDEENALYEDDDNAALELAELIGILEDEEFRNVEELYGITQEEYMLPTKEVVEKVKNHLANKHSRSR